MNATQFTLIAALNAANYWKNSENQNLFQKIATDILESKDSGIAFEVERCRKQGLIKGNDLTSKGKISIILDSRKWSNLHLSKMIGVHLREAVDRNVLVDCDKGKGTFAFLPKETLADLLEDIVTAICDKVAEGEPIGDYLTQKAIDSMVSFAGNPMVEEVIQPAVQEVITSEGGVITTDQVKEEVKKVGKKVKATTKK